MTPRRLVAVVAILAWAGSLSACHSAKRPSAEIDKETAERQALIDAMKQHPAVQNGEDSGAAGKPIEVPTSVPPKPAETNESHQHPPGDDHGS